MISASKRSLQGFPRPTRVFWMGWHSPSGGEAEKRHQGSTEPLSRKLLPLPGLPGYSSVISPLLYCIGTWTCK